MVAVTGAALIVAAALAPGPSEKPGHLLVWLLFVGSSVHVASTGWFVTSPDVRRHAVRNDRRGLIALPLCCVLACGVAALVVPVHLLNWALLALFAWQFHHFQKQNLGLVALAASSAGLSGPRPLERRLIMFAGICGIAALLGDPRLLQLNMYHRLGAVTTFVFTAYIAALAAGSFALFRASGKRPASYCALYLTALLFPLPIFVFRSPYAAVSGMTIGHGLQYLFLMGLVGLGGRSAGRRRREFARVGAIALAGGVALSAASHLHASGSAALRGVFGFYAGLLCVHFLVDARLWRLSRPFSRAFLGSRLPFLVPPTQRGITRLPIDRIPI